MCCWNREGLTEITSEEAGKILWWHQGPAGSRLTALKCRRIFPRNGNRGEIQNHFGTQDRASQSGFDVWCLWTQTYFDFIRCFRVPLIFHGWRVFWCWQMTHWKGHSFNENMGLLDVEREQRKSWCCQNTGKAVRCGKWLKNVKQNWKPAVQQTFYHMNERGEIPDTETEQRRRRKRRRITQMNIGGQRRSVDVRQKESRKDRILGFLKKCQ